MCTVHTLFAWLVVSMLWGGAFVVWNPTPPSGFWSLNQLTLLVPGAQNTSTILHSGIRPIASCSIIALPLSLALSQPPPQPVLCPTEPLTQSHTPRHAPKPHPWLPGETLRNKTLCQKNNNIEEEADPPHANPHCTALATPLRDLLL